ncbi:hypothetical protein NRE35_004397 [Salmonella enterica]|nr:hypothetical protein [Salmonella enterica]
MLKRSRSDVIPSCSNAQDVEESLTLLVPYAIKMLTYDLVFTEKLRADEVQDVVISLSRARDILESDEGYTYRELSLSDRAEYLERVEEIMSDYYFDKLTRGMNDDEITPEFLESIQGKLTNWMDVAELVCRADFFDSLYKFVNRIAHDDLRLVVIGIEIQKRRVIVDYGYSTCCGS